MGEDHDGGVMDEPMMHPRDDRPPPQAFIVGYKKVRGHPRVTRIATALADSGRDVVIIGLSGSVREEEEFAVDHHIRGVGLASFRLRGYMLEHAMRPFDQLTRWVDRLRWRR